VSSAPLRLAWMVLAGLAQALALAVPAWGSSGLLQCLAMALLVSVLSRSDLPLSSKRWALAVFAWAWLTGTLWWLFISMHRYGHLPAPLAALALLTLTAGMSLFYLLMGEVWLRLQQRAQHGIVALSLAFAACWTLAEWMRGTFFTGLPWGAVGYAHVDGLLSGGSAWLGVYGVGFMAAFLSAAWGIGLGRRVSNGRSMQWAAPTVLTALVLISAIILGKVNWTQSAGAQDVHLLQGNVPQDQKFAEERGQALQWHLDQVSALQTGLIVTPETALPSLPQHLPPGYWEALLGRSPAVPSAPRAVLVGLPMPTASGGYANSAVGWHAQQGPDEYRFDKHHLVPFGETIPPLFAWFVRMMQIPLGDFDAGALSQPHWRWQNQVIAANICYEDLFGEELAQRMWQGGPAPTVWVNMSNIAWFGDTVAVDQHLNISRMRALELQRPMLRATNTGATAIIDHQGRVQAQLAPYTQGVLSGRFEGRSGITPYVHWAGRYGLWPMVFLCMVVIAALAWSGRARKRH
jgi:apolipoprotein N-acyltransferase